LLLPLQVLVGIFIYIVCCVLFKNDNLFYFLNYLKELISQHKKTDADEV